MKNNFILSSLLFIGFTTTNYSHADQQLVDVLLKTYQSQGAKSANILQGKKLWLTEFSAKEPFSKRSCVTCHTSNLQNSGKHIKTGKKITAMSPLINSKSLNNSKKINKWFKRNCKWTMGRECTAQEKSDLLLFISKQ